MRKIVRFLTLAVLLAAPWGGYFNQVHAQTLTVHDGTGTNRYVPFYGYYADEDQQNQMIYPASELTAMVGKNITEMVFYYSSVGSYGSGVGNWTVSIGETAATTLSGLDNATALTEVFSGALDALFNSTEQTLTITFDNGYAYQGGNLLVEFYHEETGTYLDYYFYGETATGASYCYNSQCDFLPKTTFSYETPASCAKPTGLAATLTPGSGTIATLNWTAGGTETEWTVEYSTSADFSSNVSSTTATGTPTANLTGLTPETQYYARVKAVCGVGDESNWSNSVTFTPSNALTLTVNDGSATNGYVPVYGYYVDGSIVSQFIIPAASLSSIQWATLNQMTFYATQSSIDWGSAQFEVYVTEVDYTTFSGTTLVDWTTMTKVMNAGSLSVSGNQMVVTFDTPYQYTGGNLMIGVKQTVSGDYVTSTWQGVSATGASLGGDGTGSQQNFLPKVTFAFTPGVAPSCVKPTALAAGSVTATGATLSWTAGGTETQWTVEYGTAADFTGAASQNVATNPFTLTGLNPATTYYVRVKAVCSGSDESDWSTAATFATECAAIAAVGYTQNFDALTAGNNVLPLCWSYINTTTYSSYQVYPRAYNYSAQSGSNCLYFYSYDYSGGYYDYDPQPQYAILPEMTGLSGKQVTLSAKGYYSSSTFKIGTMSNPANAATFTEIAEQTLTTSYAEYVFDIPPTTDAYLAIMIDAADASRNTNAVYIDDISIAEPPTCPKPSALMLETPSSRTAHTATLTWTNGDAETAWQIVYSTESTFDPDGATPVDVTTKPYTLTGLNASTTYYAYVLANCGGGDYSAWCTTKATFTTTNGIGTPTSLAVDNATLTHNTATVTWSRVATNDLHESFDIYLSTDGTAPTAETVPTYTGITAMTYTFTGLTEATTYYVWVRDVCGTDGTSAWSSRLTINTTVFCPAPTGVAVSSATAHGATISWTGTSDSYNVYVGKATVNNTTYDFEDNAISADFTNDATNAWTVTNSDKHAGTYSIKSAGGFSSTQSDLTLTVDLTEAATLTFWDKASSEGSYDYGRFLLDGVQKHETSGTSNSWTERTYELTAGSHTLVWRYYKDISGNSGDDCYYVDDITITSMDVASWERYEAPASPYVLFDDGAIDPETDYAVKVVGVCESTESHYESATVLFTTSADCGASNAAVSNVSFHGADVTWDGSSDAGYTVSYRTATAFDGINEEFATSSLPTGWETKSGLLSSVMGGTALTSGSGWSTDSYALGTYNVKANIFGTSCNKWLIAPVTFLPAGAVLNFDMALTDYYSSDPIEDNTAQADDRFVVLISTDNMATWTILREWNNSGSTYVYNNIATAGEHVNIDLSAYAATNVRIAFYGESTESGGDNDLHIDNVVIGTPVAAGAWRSVDVASSPATIEDLKDGTAYEVKVSPVCDPSIETNIAEFTTLALPTLNVSANNWYALSSPMHDAGQTYESVAKVENLTTGTYDFLRYDEPSSTWESQKSGTGHTGFSTLEAGRGYIYRRANDAVLKVDGEPNTANVDVAITKDVDGWNLIGNPFMVPIRLNTTYMAPSSTAVLTSGGYTLSTKGMWTAITSSTNIAAGQAVLVNATTAGTLTLRPSASKSAASGEENGQGFLFSLSNDVYSDVAYAMFADGEGLPKISHLNPEAPMLSIDGYAIAMMEQGVERFPLSVSGQGKYTLALKENSADATYLHLIDRATGRDIDLLATPEYTFMANGQADRFEVRLMPGMDENGNVNFVYIDGTRLIVDGEGELQVFDVMGRQLGSAQVAGTATLDRSALGIVSAGVYVVRLGGNSQKIVVK